MSFKEKFRNHFQDLITEAVLNGGVITKSSFAYPIEKYIDAFKFTKVRFRYYFDEEKNKLEIRVSLMYSNYYVAAVFKGKIINCEFEYEYDELYCLCGNYSDGLYRFEFKLDDKSIFDGLMYKFDDLINQDDVLEELKEYLMLGKPDSEKNLWSMNPQPNNYNFWTRRYTGNIKDFCIFRGITYNF